jgi:uncharacterized membrane protein
MDLERAKLFYAFSCIMLGIIILSPTLFALVPLPEGEKFSELWLLGSNHMIENDAFNIRLGETHSFYLGVNNHMNDLEYYKVYVKLRNQTEASQETSAKLPVSSEPIFEYRLFLRNNETWTRPFTFSFESISLEDNISRVSRLSIDGNNISLDKVVARNNASGRFLCQMLFELWIYNATTSSFQNHDRSVWFWLNIIEQP